MKSKINHSIQGSVLLVTMCTSGVIILALGSYLWLVSSHNLSIMRSLAWNSALTVAEAGVEEALTQVQYNDSNHLMNNSWSNMNNGWYYKKRDVDPGVSYYEVMIQKADPPVIISTGTVPAPVSALAPSANYGLILATASTSTSVVKRRIRVNTRRRPLYMGAMVADEHIDLSGNGISTDGFDSTDPNYNVLGKYNVSFRKASGDVACNSSVANAIDLGNAKIMGHVSTGSGGLANAGANASVGDVAWVSVPTKGVKVGWTSDDAHFDISSVPNPTAPSGTWSTAYTTSLGGTNILGSLLGPTYCTLSSFTGNVRVIGDVTLWVKGSVTFASSDSLEITPGSSLKLYVGDQSGAPVSATIGGVGNDGYATSFQYFGLPTNNSIGFQANAAFTGTIYAPQADFKLGGGGSDDYDFVGACVVKTAKMNGHFKFHFDEALERTLWLGYVAQGWNELNPNAPIN